ncbi:MAG TPA: NlpC/P60 family protein [Actinobacteria bacterium]|jgi:cell wall-associated NlpC family hydrolase|nr:NlpC/P60 family protein [Actinomycetota bacterium]
MRDVARRLRPALWVAVAAGMVASLVSAPLLGQEHGGQLAAGTVHQARPAAAGEGLGRVKATGSAAAGISLAGQRQLASGSLPVASLDSFAATPVVAPLRHLLQADLLVVAPATLPRAVAAKVRRLPGVVSAELVDAGTIRVGGSNAAMLGVDPSAFRAFAAAPTARATTLWQSVADGGVAVSYTMGQQDKLPLGGLVQVTGRQSQRLRVGGFGTVGIAGVDAVVSDAVARSLGIPAANALVISAPRAQLVTLMRQVKALLPATAAIAPLVAQAAPGAVASAGIASAGLAAAAGAAGGDGISAADGPGMTPAEIRAFLTAALSRVGKPYVWGAAGPDAFDCSGLVQWSMRQAGLVMPRVAADQAQTGPLIPLSDLRPGDLLFYHTDPTAPTSISHVAIYLGNGLMEQAPEPGMDVQVVPADFGAEFAGAVEVYPRVAAAAAGSIAG